MSLNPTFHSFLPSPQFFFFCQFGLDYAAEYQWIHLTELYFFAQIMWTTRFSKYTQRPNHHHNSGKEMQQIQIMHWILALCVWKWDIWFNVPFCYLKQFSLPCLTWKSIEKCSLWCALEGKAPEVIRTKNYYTFLLYSLFSHRTIEIQISHPHIRKSGAKVAWATCLLQNLVQVSKPPYAYLFYM